MRTNILFASVLASALAVTLPAHAQVLGGGGSLVGGVGGTLGGSLGHIGGSATGSLDGMGHLDTNTLHEQERAERLQRRAVAAQRRAAQAADRATGEVGGPLQSATGALDAQARGAGNAGGNIDGAAGALAASTRGAGTVAGALDAAQAHGAGNAGGNVDGAAGALAASARGAGTVAGALDASQAPALPSSHADASSLPDARAVAPLRNVAGATLDGQASGMAHMLKRTNADGTVRGRGAAHSAMTDGRVVGAVSAIGQGAAQATVPRAAGTPSSSPAKAIPHSPLDALAPQQTHAHGQASGGGSSALDIGDEGTADAPVSKKPKTNASTHAGGHANAGANADRTSGVSARGSAEADAGAKANVTP